MTTETMGLAHPLSNATDTSAQILPWCDFFEVLRILARRIPAEMVSVAALCRPAPMSEELSDAVRGFGMAMLSHPDMAVAYRVFRCLPFPAIIWATLTHFRPVAFFEAFGNRAFSHGYMIPRWYE